MATVVYQSGDIQGPSQENSSPVAVVPLFIYVRVDIAPVWVGLNKYGGSNSNLDAAGTLVTQRSLLPHVGVFNNALQSLFPGQDVAACELLTPVDRIQWVYTFQTDFDPTGNRVIFLDVPDGFRCQLAVATN